jgi:hypothetical protein
MSAPSSRRRLGAFAALALTAGLGASGCHTFKYFDITYSFEQASLDDSTIRTITQCRIYVTGADQAQWVLRGCPNHDTSMDPHLGGAFEFSTFADSGQLTFEVVGFVGETANRDCALADGQTSVPVTSMGTIMSTVLVKGTGKPNCSLVTPAGDGGT